MNTGQFKKGCSPWNKGLSPTPEIRKKMGIANIGNKYTLGRKHTAETKEKIRIIHKGKHHSPSTEFKKGSGVGDKNVNWKPDNQLTYLSIHWWIRTHFKKTGVCEHCKLSKNTEWSDKKHAYNSRNRDAWQEVCRKCHMIYDASVLGVQRGRH